MRVPRRIRTSKPMSILLNFLNALNNVLECLAIFLTIIAVIVMLVLAIWYVVIYQEIFKAFTLCLASSIIIYVRRILFE